MEQYNAWYRLVSTDGRFLNDVPILYRTYDMCFAAVKSYSRAIYATPRYVLNEQICLEAVSKDAFSIILIPAEFHTIDVCTTAIEQNICSFGYMKNNTIKEKLRPYYNKVYMRLFRGY